MRISGFIGPELYWLSVYLLIFFLLRILPDAQSKDALIDWLVFLIPLFLLPLLIYLSYQQWFSQHWLILRMLVSSLVGLHYVLSLALGMYSRQDAGTGTMYLFCFAVSLIILFVLLLIRLLLR